MQQDSFTTIQNKRDIANMKRMKHEASTGPTRHHYFEGARSVLGHFSIDWPMLKKEGVGASRQKPYCVYYLHRFIGRYLFGQNLTSTRWNAESCVAFVLRLRRQLPPSPNFRGFYQGRFDGLWVFFPHRLVPGLWDQGVSPHLCDARESPYI